MTYRKQVFFQDIVHNFIGQGEKMNIKYIDFRRLNKYTKLYLKNADLKDFMKIKIDFIIAVILDGAGINDYFEYEFYKKRRNERKKFVVRKKRKIIVRKFNLSGSNSPQLCCVTNLFK